MTHLPHRNQRWPSRSVIQRKTTFYSVKAAFPVTQRPIFGTITLHDLNDFRLFAYVVEEMSLTGAAKKLGLPRSNISRRLAMLEDDLGLRLIQRSTRSLTVTDIGQTFYAHCRAMLAEAEAATEIIQRQKSEPQGTIRIACPSSLIHFELGPIVADFMIAYPKVTVILESTNRRVDVLREGIDLAIRIRFPPLEDTDLIVRRIKSDDQILVCAPSLLPDGPLTHPSQLEGLPTLSWGVNQSHHVWDLVSPDGEPYRHAYQPRLITQEMSGLVHGAVAGVGFVRLPGVIVRPMIERGELVEALPGWKPVCGIIHAVFPSRRGMLPTVRAFLDYCYERFNAETQTGTLAP